MSKGVRSIEGAGKNQWKKAAVILAVLGVILVAALLIVLPQWKQKNSLETTEMEKWVAVLPFDNLSGDPDQEYFSDGMMDEILDRLFKIGDLKVISRTSSMRYRNSDLPLKEIARELGVSAILEGSVRRAGNLIRITVQLIDARTDAHLWSETYDGDLSDLSRIFIVQSDVAQSVARELKAVISAKEQERVKKIPDIDPVVYDEYLKARSYSGDFTRESLTKALEILNSAIKIDPDWAPLYVILTQVWMGIQQMGYEAPDVAAPKIFAYLNKALELDPDLAEAHCISAMFAHLVEWNWEKSEEEFLKVLAINPNDALSRVFYSQLLAVLHRNDEALAQGKIAFRLDPLNPNMKCWYAAAPMATGDFKTGLSLGEEVAAIDPGNIMAHSLIVFAGYKCKAYDKVIKSEKYLLPFPVEEDTFKEIERIYSESGIISAYEEIMKHLEKFAETNYVGFLDMSYRYLFANQPDKAMDWVEKGFEMHDPQMTYISTEMYNHDPLFKNPRFIAICEKMKLPLPKSN